MAFSVSVFAVNADLSSPVDAPGSRSEPEASFYVVGSSWGRRSAVI